MDKIAYGLDLSNEVANDNMKIIMQELGITEKEINDEYYSKMTKYDFYWKSNSNWYHRKENGVCVINDDAPKKAKNSYNNYMEQRKRKYGDNDTR